MKTFILRLTAVLLLLSLSSGAALKPVSKDPYVGAIVIDCSTGKVIFEDNADVPAYPASILKILNLLIIVENVRQGKATLSERIPVTAEAARTGGSQVFLKEHEVFILDDLLYAMMIQSANDVAVALAIHYGGSKEGFLKIMNERARKIGMRDTIFRSVHGLPPSKGDRPDVTTARDMALLAMEVVKQPLALKYTSTAERGFRDNKFIMRTHNGLLGTVDGCDGLKTGYIRAAGYSIVATAKREGRRVVVVILGSRDKVTRDRKARELISNAFMNLPPLEQSKPAVNLVQIDKDEAVEQEGAAAAAEGQSRRTYVLKGLAAAGVILILLAVSRSVMKKRFRKYDFY